MKKIFISSLCLLLCLTLTGCGNKNLDLEKIKQEIIALKDDHYEMSGISTALDKVEVFQNMTVTYEYDLEKLLGIDVTNINQAIYAYKENSMVSYLIINPNDGKLKDVKKEINKYFDNLNNKNLSNEDKDLLNNRQELLLDNYLVYIIAENSSSIADTIKDEARNGILSMVMDNTKDNLKQFSEIDPELLDEFVVLTPMSIINSNLVIIVKPKDGKTEEAKKQIESYIKKIESNFQNYLPDQYDIIKNRHEEKYGNYLIYIATTNNDKVMNVIKK